MSWHTGPMAAFDTETTGTDPTECRIVSACVAWIEVGKEPLVDASLIDPGVEIPDEAAAVHGITTERARAEGRPPETVLPVIAADLVSAWRQGHPVIAMNAAYDITVLECELARHGLPSLAQRLDGLPMLLVDPLVIDRKLDRYRKGKKRLEDLCRVYGVTNDAAHDASGDALAAARVAWKQAVRFGDELPGDLVELQAWQAAAHRAWAEDFEAYMRREIDPECVIERDWPLRQAVST